LPFEAQEAVLDLIDELTTDVRIRSRPRQASRDEVFEVARQFGGKQYVVWLVARFDYRSQEVDIVSIGHVVRE